MWKSLQKQLKKKGILGRSERVYNSAVTEYIYIIVSGGQKFGGQYYSRYLSNEGLHSIFMVKRVCRNLEVLNSVCAWWGVKYRRATKYRRTNKDWIFALSRVAVTLHLHSELGLRGMWNQKLTIMENQNLEPVIITADLMTAPEQIEMKNLVFSYLPRIFLTQEWGNWICSKVG